MSAKSKGLWALVVLGVLALVVLLRQDDGDLTSRSQRRPDQTALDGAEQHDQPEDCSTFATSAGAGPSVGASPVADVPESGEAPGPVQDVDSLNPQPPPEGTVWGTVSVGAGKRVVDAKVEIAALMPSSALMGSLRIPMDLSEDGQFRRDGLPVGKYLLVATHPDCASHRVAFELQRGRGAGPIQVFLAGGGALLIRALGSRGEGFPNDRFAVRPTSQAGGEPLATGATDPDGNLAIDDLEPGRYSVERLGGIRERCTATVQEGKRTELTFGGGASLLGTLFGPDGRPVGEAELLLTTAFERSPSREVLRKVYDESTSTRSYSTRTATAGPSSSPAWPPGATTSSCLPAPPN